MRYLHPVTLSERFVASGVYRLSDADGQIDRIVEYWSIHEMPDGAHFARVDVDGRDGGDGRSLLIEAWRSPLHEGGRIERFDVLASGAPGDAVQQVRATYTRFDDHMEIGRTVGGEPRQYDELDLPAACIVFPAARVFVGELIEQAAICSADEFPVFLYDHHFNDDSAFQGFIHQDAANYVKDGSLTTDSHEKLARCYRWQHPPPTLAIGETLVWLDDHNMLLALEMESGQRILLTNYARRPEPET